MGSAISRTACQQIPQHMQFC
uniref:Uncharacterized protein n=1 Tax=Anguilla anguilla TaxID=7936 RepID=A0A0E9SWU1_ANGAN